MLKNKDNIVGNEKLSTDNNTSETVNCKETNFSIGQEIEVIPTGFKEYGVFCDCGNSFSGLVHISRITSKFVRNVNDYFTIGKPFTAKIIEIHNDTKKLSLSTKEFNLEAKKLDSEDNNKFGF